MNPDTDVDMDIVEMDMEQVMDDAMEEVVSSTVPMISVTPTSPSKSDLHEENEENETKEVITKGLQGPKKDKTAQSIAKMEEDQIVLAYKSISNFVKALNEVFGDEFASLQLYSHLLEKTGLIHEEPIKKHISLFRKWLKDNESLILTKNYKHYQEIGHIVAPIQYSEKVFVDMASILRVADQEQLDSIHTHLLTISAIVDPSSEAKRLLREEQRRKKHEKNSSSSKNLENGNGNGNGNGNEDDFLGNIFKKIGDSVNNTDSSNPLEMVSSVLQSGVLQDVMSTMNEGLSEGNLDFGKILGSLGKVIGGMTSPGSPSSD